MKINPTYRSVHSAVKNGRLDSFSQLMIDHNRIIVFIVHICVTSAHYN